MKDEASYPGQPYELDEEKISWKKAMGFPRGDKPQAPPPRLNTDSLYYLLMAEYTLSRLEVLSDAIEPKNHISKEMQRTVRTTQNFLKSLRSSLKLDRV